MQANGQDSHIPLPNPAVLHTALGAVLISFSGVWVKVADTTPTISAFYRVLFGGIILLFAAGFKGELKGKSLRDPLMGIACGLIFALDLIFWHTSILYIGPGLATILGNFQVLLITAIGVVFLGEKIRLHFLCSLPLAMLGLFLIVGVKWRQISGQYALGIGLALTTAVCYTGFILLLRHLQAEQKGKSTFFTMMFLSFATAIFLSAKAFWTGDSFAIPDLKTGLALASMGLFSQAVGWILISNALPKIPASLASMLLLLQPALAFAWDVFFFQRETSLLNWSGVIVILAAIYMATLGGSSSEKN